MMGKNYGLCCGVKNAEGEIIRGEHGYKTEEEVTDDSHSLCYDCKLLTYHYTGLTKFLSQEELGDLEKLLDNI